MDLSPCLMSHWPIGRVLAKPNNDPTKRGALTSDERVLQQASADQKMLAHWRVLDGELRFDGQGDSLSTVRQDYANYELWLIGRLALKATAEFICEVIRRCRSGSARR